MLLLAATSGPVLEQADRMSKGLEDHPLPYFLALVLAVVGFLATAYSTASWLGAKRERNLYRELLSKEEKASLELRRERDDARAEMQHNLIKLLLAAEGLVRVRDELAAKGKTP